MANPYFNAVYYLQQNPDVFAAGYTVDTAWDHYAQYGANEAYAIGGATRAPNPWFDAKYYLNNNPDLIAAGVTPANALDHFFAFGGTAAEDRAPNATIAANPITEASLLAYAKANADLLTAFGIAADATELTVAQQNNLITQFYAFGYSEERPSAPTTVEQPDPNQGETYTLTTGVDVLTGTAGDDTFVGTSSATTPTVNLGDNLDGGAGTDTLSITSNLAGAIPSIVTKNVEVYSINSSANGTLAVNGLSTAPDTVKFVGGGNNTFTLSGVGTATAIALESEAGQITLTLDGVGGTADELSLSLNGAKSTSSVAAAGVETFNVTTSGAASTLAALTGAQGSKLVVSGDKALTVTTALANTFTTIDASAATAAVNLGVATGGNVKVTGGSGDDRFAVAGLDNNDTVDGGDGVDTLAVGADVTASNVSKVSNIEKLEFTAATTQDLSLVAATGIDTFVYSLAAASVAATKNENGFDHIVSGATSGTFAATQAVDGPTDVLNVELANSDLTTLTATNYETVNLVSSAGSATGSVTNTVTTLGNSAGANVVITGGANLTITNVGAQGTFDASALTGKFVVTGSAAADVIKGGSAVDTITGGVGADVLTGGAGADIFVSVAADTTLTAFDTISDFNNGGADILRMAAANDVNANVAADPVAGTTAKIVSGKATFAAADDTLAEKLTTLNAQLAADKVVFFEQGSDTYVFGSGATAATPADAFMIKLAGVVGLDSISESTSTAGDFTLA